MKYGGTISSTLLVIGLATQLAACTSLISPPSSESSDSLAIRKDLESCRSSSLLEIPPKMVITSHAISMPSQTMCSAAAERGSQYCYTIPGFRREAVEEDLNAEARAEVFSACLMVKRYSEQAILSRTKHKLGERPGHQHVLPDSHVANTSYEVVSGTQGLVVSATEQLLEAQRSRPWQGIKDCDVCPRMVQVPAGSFKMGSTVGSSEQPIHTVKIASFLLGKYEVTQAEWLAVMGDNPSANKSCGRLCPVDRISWNKAQEFLQRLNRRTGMDYRLPTEAEWEYAARAGRKALAAEEVDQTLGHFAWFAGNSGGELHLVGQKMPNAFGLHDMQGNVWEWVEDGLHDNYQGASPTGQARQPKGAQDKRVLRGGSYFDNPRLLRPTHRNADTPDAAYVFFGLRIARDLGPVTVKAEQASDSREKSQ